MLLVFVGPVMRADVLVSCPATQAGAGPLEASLEARPSTPLPREERGQQQRLTLSGKAAGAARDAAHSVLAVQGPPRA
ncbi:hypothetical protein VTN02DRAFT_1310 [Thermoascus thermophilus]